jgi:hypothetical protein
MNKAESKDRYGAFRFPAGTRLSTVRAALSEIEHCEGDSKVNGIDVTQSEGEIKLVLHLGPKDQ